MPLYEYYCPDCTETFETLRPAAKADVPTPCPECQRESSQRILSLFASAVKSDRAASLQPVGPMAGSCCGGSCGCH